LERCWVRRSRLRVKERVIPHAQAPLCTCSWHKKETFHVSLSSFSPVQHSVVDIGEVLGQAQPSTSEGKSDPTCTSPIVHMLMAYERNVPRWFIIILAGAALIY
jgi:hypothetical protein